MKLKLLANALCNTNSKSSPMALSQVNEHKCPLWTVIMKSKYFFFIITLTSAAFIYMILCQATLAWSTSYGRSRSSKCWREKCCYKQANHPTSSENKQQAQGAMSLNDSSVTDKWTLRLPADTNVKNCRSISQDASRSRSQTSNIQYCSKGQETSIQF